MRTLISLGFIILASCSISKTNSLSNKSGVPTIKNKMPVSIVYIKPEPIDSLKNSLQKEFKEKGIDTPTASELGRLIGTSIVNSAKMLHISKGSKSNISQEEMDEKVLGGTALVANVLYLKFYQRGNGIDSIQWSMNYVPDQKKINPKKHCFVPENKTPINAINEFIDSLITSPDFK